MATNSVASQRELSAYYNIIIETNAVEPFWLSIFNLTNIYVLNRPNKHSIGKVDCVQIVDLGFMQFT